MANPGVRNRKLLTFAQANCQDLKAGTHYEDLKQLFTVKPADIICVAESWLSEEIFDSMFSLPGYNLFRRDRTVGVGGGVAVYVDKSIKARVLASSADGSRNSIDFLVLEISIGVSEKLLLGAIYRPPKVGGINHFFEVITELYPLYNRLVITGDFNSNMLRKYHDSEVISQFVQTNDLFLVPLKPTFRGGGRGENESLIDLCIMDCEDNFIAAEQEPSPFSGHDCIRISYNFELERGAAEKRTARDFRGLEAEAFLRDLSCNNWQEFYDTSSIDQKVKFLNEVLTECLDVHAPVRSFTRTQRPTTAWITEEIKETMRQRDRALRAYRTSCKGRRTGVTGTTDEHGVKGNAEELKKFKVLRNRVKTIVRDAKRKFYGEALSRVKDPKSTWQRMRQLGLLKSKNEGQELGVPVEELNTFFAASGLSGDNPATTYEPREFDDSRFFFAHITFECLMKAICKASCCSPGADSISMRVINIALPVLLKPLHHLFNFSLQSSTFPEIWKQALIRPIPKTKSPAGPSDYRPISLLCSLSKILERIVADQLSEFLEANNLLDCFQSAYRKNHSTQTALVRIAEYVSEGIDNRQLTGMVLFDFSKAFDRVRHDILLVKLAKLRISDSAIFWFADYLNGRSQAVLGAGNSRSRFITNSTGVPQGSVLGPLLFSLYMSDLKDALSGCDYNLYADDLQIFCRESPKDINLIGRKLNRDILLVRIWAATNGLLLNSEKTHAIMFGSGSYVRQLHEGQMPTLLNGRAVVPFEYSVKVLGVILTENFQWREQTTAVAKTINSTLYRLKVCRHLLPTEARIALIRALVTPIVDYCDILLYGISMDYNKTIDVAFNSCVRFIFDVSRFDHISPFYRQLGWLRVEERRELNLMCTVHSVLTDGRPQYLRQLFTWKDTRDIKTRDGLKNKLKIENFRTETRRNSFSVAAAYGWNALPAAVLGLPKKAFRTAMWCMLESGAKLIPDKP